MLRGFIFSILLAGGLAQAQPFFGTRIDFGLFPGFAPLLGIQAGFETGRDAGGLGLRVSGSTLIFISRGSLDAYLRLPIDSEGRSVHLGGGVAAYPFFLPGPISCLPDTPCSPAGTVLVLHGLLGYQWREPNGQYWYVELVPGLTQGGGQAGLLLTLTLGVNLY